MSISNQHLSDRQPGFGTEWQQFSFPALFDYWQLGVEEMMKGRMEREHDRHV
jgi:hypothetical protein